MKSWFVRDFVLVRCQLLHRDLHRRDCCALKDRLHCDSPPVSVPPRRKPTTVCIALATRARNKPRIRHSRSLAEQLERRPDLTYLFTVVGPRGHGLLPGEQQAEHTDIFTPAVAICQLLLLRRINRDSAKPERPRTG